jgi:hypothetical protein
MSAGKIGARVVFAAVGVLVATAFAAASASAETKVFANQGCELWVAPSAVEAHVESVGAAGGGFPKSLGQGGRGDGVSGTILLSAKGTIVVCVDQGGGAGGVEAAGGGGYSGASGAAGSVTAGGGGGGAEYGLGAGGGDVGKPGESGEVCPVGGGGRLAEGGGAGTLAEGGLGGKCEAGSGSPAEKSGSNGAALQGGAGAMPSCFEGKCNGVGGGGGGGGYYGGGGGALASGGGGGSDFCGNGALACETHSAVGTVHGAGKGATEAHVTLTITPLPAPTITKITPTSGPATGDKVVTITGTNFKYVRSVNFGGVAAKGYVVNEAGTEIGAVSPPKEVAGIVDVTVTTVVSGTSAISKKDHYKYLPVITHVEPRFGSVGGFERILVFGFGFSPGPPEAGGATFAFGTTPATASACFGEHQVCEVTTPAHAAGTVDVRATVNGATSAKTKADQFTFG